MKAESRQIPQTLVARLKCVCCVPRKNISLTRAEFHFSWVYTFSARLSCLRNWANHDRYGCDPAVV